MFFVLLAGLIWSFGPFIVRNINNAELIPWQYSLIRGSAIFLILNIYLFLNEGNMDEGFKLMKDIVNNHPFSPFLKRALLKLGVYHYSLSNSSESIINFKRVIEEFPGSIESTEALEGLKNVYIDIGDISSCFNYVKQLSGVSVNSLAKDSITYQAAEILYLRNDYNKAIQALKEYLNNFPNGIFRLSAHFYKAESLFNTNNFNLLPYKMFTTW